MRTNDRRTKMDLALWSGKALETATNGRPILFGPEW